MAASGSCARAPAQLMAAPSEPQTYPKTSELIQAMRSADAGERADALAMLSEVVGSAYGEAGAELGEAVRQAGGVALLAWLLADPYDQVQQQALLVIGNLCSDSVDPNSAATKQQLLYNGAGRSLLACVFSDDPYMLILACGALQNLCYDRDWATFVVEHGAHQALDSLLGCDDPMIQRYASGALTNIATHGLEVTQLSEEGLAAVKLRIETKEAEERTRRYAVQTLALAVRAIPHAARQRRAQSAKRRLATALGARGPRVITRSHSGSSSQSSGSYFSACTSASGSGSTASKDSHDWRSPSNQMIRREGGPSEGGPGPLLQV